MLITYIFIFVASMCIGSFLSVVVTRLDQKEGIINGRSECPNCHATIRWYDLIPFFSFILLRARCRHCKAPISYIYPLIELATGTVFLLLFIKFSLLGWLYLALMLSICALLVSIIFFDYLFYIIPDKVILVILTLTLVLNLQFKRDELWMTFITGLIMSGLFAIMYLVSQGTWIGLGDIKLIFTIGFMLGYPNGIIAIVGSVWLAAIVGLGLLALKKATPKTAIPFGSFISIISLLTIIYQNDIQKIVNQYFF